MKKIKKNKKQIPAYAFGIDQMNGAIGIGSVLGSGMSGVSEEGSGASIAGGALGGAAKGASAGMALGPWGAAAGAVIGAAGGLFTGFKKRKQIQEQKRRKQNMLDTQIGLNNTAEMESEYWDDNTLAYSYANGGILPDLAYVDNNEVVRDVNGNIDQVPNTKPGTDNHLIDASGLESVLSDKLKRPGTNKTFAQEGEKLIKMTKSSKGTDKFAENTNRLNKANANKRYNQLLTKQEELKNKKGIKPKSKGIPAYQDGKRSVLQDMVLSTILGNNTLPIVDRNQAEGVTGFGALMQNAFTKDGWVGKAADKINNLDWTSGFKSMPGPAPGRAYTYSNDILPTFNAVDTPNVEVNEYDPTLNAIETKSSAVAPTKTAKKTIPTKQTYLNSFNRAPTPPVQVFAGELPGLPTPTLTLNKPELAETTIPSKVSRDRAAQSKKFNIGDLGDLTALAPTFYNFMQGLRKPEIEETVLNPYAGSTTRALAKRRLNIEPTLAANRRSRAIANYNMANLNANTGMNLAGRTQMAVSEYAQNADLYANRDNANNAYLGEYANMLNNLGQQYVQSQTMTNDLNARNRAAARNYAANAASQLGEWSQVQKQMKNQQRRDDMMYPLLENFLSQGYTSDQIKQIRKAYGSK